MPAPIGLRHLPEKSEDDEEPNENPGSNHDLTLHAIVHGFEVVDATMSARPDHVCTFRQSRSPDSARSFTQRLRTSLSRFFASAPGGFVGVTVSQRVRFADNGPIDQALA